MSEVELNPIPELLRPKLKYTVVDNNFELEAMLTVLESAEVVAIDAERASGFRYGQSAYLIQVAVENTAIFLLDPIAEFGSTQLEKIKEEISSKTWIIHAASQDLPCLTEFGITPTKILDTELAGRLLGLPKVSLSSMTEIFLQLTLAKEHSAVDWSKRPLPDDWLNYAALDVDVLFDLWKMVELELIKNNRYEIAMQEFKHLLVIEVKPEKLERWRSLTGIHEIKDQRQLTVLRSLWLAREELAKAKDISPGRLVPDSSFVALVKASPKSKSELAGLRAFAGRATRTYLDTWWNAYERGMLDRNLVELRPKSTGIPNHRNWVNKFPEAHARLAWMKKLLANLSEQMSIPVENLVSPDVVRNICFAPPEIDLPNLRMSLEARMVRPWQIDLVMELFIQALQQTQIPPEEPKASAPAQP